MKTVAHNAIIKNVFDAWAVLTRSSSSSKAQRYRTMSTIEVRNTIASFIRRSTNYVTAVAGLGIDQTFAQPLTTKCAKSAAPKPRRTNTIVNLTVHCVAAIILLEIRSAACVSKPHTF